MEVSTLTYNLGNLGFWMCSTGWFKQNCFRSHCSPIVGSLVGLGSFAVRPGSCPFFRQIKRKGITLSFNWGWSFTNSGLGLDSGSQILWCRGPTDDMIHDKLSLSTLILECKEYLLILECKTQANCCVCMNELWAVLRIGKMGPASGSHHTGPSLEL